LGLRTAQWLADKGARHLVLVGRNGWPDAVERALAGLRKHGAQAHFFQADVADPMQTEKLLAAIRDTLPPLRGIIHAAGISDDGLLSQQSAARFSRVLEPKVAGAWNLHQLTQETPLDFFVLFAAAAGILGGVGQGAYAAANAFLDALAHYRNALGLAGLSVDWGLWDAGMAAKNAAYQRRLADRGIRAMPADRALAQLERWIGGGVPQLVAMDIDWNRYARHEVADRQWPFLSEVWPADDVGKPKGQASFLARLERLDPAERLEALAEQIESELVAALQVPARKLDRQKGFSEMGVDSLLALEVKDRLQSALGRPLPSTLLFEYPAVDLLADFLLREVFPPSNWALPAAGVEEIGALTSEEVETRLARKLDALGSLL
jgi:acyl carrier protein